MDSSAGVSYCQKREQKYDGTFFLLYYEACKLKIVTKAGLRFLKWLGKVLLTHLFFSDALLMEMIVIEKMFNYSCIFFI